MKTQLKKGIIEIFVLGVLKQGESYGYKIVSDLQDVIEVSESTLYPILRRLEASNALTTYQVEHNGRLRKYYKISKEGLLRLEAFKQEWLDVKKVYDFILSSEEKEGTR